MEAVMAAGTPVVITGGVSRTQRNKNSSHSEAVTSTVVAGRNLNIIATAGDINSQGAQLSAEGDALLHANDNINLGFATDSHSQTADNKHSGFAIDNRDWLSPAGVYHNKAQGEGALDKATGTLLSVGGQSTLQTEQGDINILGSTVVAGGDNLINTARHINIRSTQNSRNQSEYNHNQGIGSAQVSDTERFDGYMSHKSHNSDNQVEQIKSQLGSLSGNIHIQAGGDYTQQVANLTADQNIDIRAQRIDILADHNRGKSHQSEKDLKIGQFSKVSSPLIDLINSTDETINSKADDRTRTLQGMAAVAQGYQTYSTITNGGALIKAETGTGFKISQSRQDSRYTQSQSNALNAGGNISLTSHEGDIRVQHSQIKAGDTIALNSAKDILLKAGQNQQQANGKNSNAGLSVGMGVSVGAQTGIYIYGEAGWGSGKNHLDANTHSNTTLQSDKLVLNSKGDTTLKDASASAKRIDTDIGGKLHIESLQDQVEQSSSQTGAGVRVQVSFGTAWEVGGNFSSDKTSGSLSAVNQQSDLFAGDGGYHINADSVHLKGGAITATAAKEHNQLTTNQLSFEDIRNHSNYSASNIALAGSYGSHNPSQNPDSQTFRDSELGNAFANSAGDEGFSYSPVLPQHSSGKDNSTTLATLSAGNITIGGRESSVEALGIHSDAASAHRALAELPDLQAILAQQKTVAQATATIATAARTFSSDRAKAAEREKAEARAHAEQQLQQRNDGSWENYQRLPESQKQAQLSLHSLGYAQAAEKAQDWGIGGNKSRALNATTTLITGALGGQTNLQVAANTLAPYAAASIGSTVGHGTNQNETAQAISHFILGGTLAYINGGDPLSGGSAAVAAEKTAQYLSGQYNDGKTAIDPNTGEFNPNLLPEPIKAEIRSVTGAIASVVGATGDGGAALNAQIAGVVGQNAVENNDVGASYSAWKKEQELLKKDLQEYEKLKQEQRQMLRQVSGFLIDFIPVIGDIKGFTEAETKGDYFFAALGVIPLYGDAAQKVHKAEKAYEVAKAAKDAEKMKVAMQEARKGADLPYDSRAIRTELEKRYGTENVVSTTIPPNNFKNVKLAGNRHPVTGIVFDRKGFPIFDDIAKFDTKISIYIFKSVTYEQQMKIATQEIAKSIKQGKIKESNFTPEQLKAIYKGDAKIPDYTWHHHQDFGRMQLVPTRDHFRTGHVGGESIQKGK